jgi:hypothetical protein
MTETKLFLLGVGVVSADDVASTIVYHRAMAAKVGAQQPNKRQYSPYSSDNHKNDANGVNIESVLVRTHGDREIQNSTDREGDDACYQSTNHG